MLKKMRARIPAVYVCGVLALLPLVFHDGFFDINRVKTAFFVLWTLGSSALYLFTGKAAFTKKHIPLLVFCMLSALSTLVSADPVSAFWGSGGRLNGFITILCLCLGAWLASQSKYRLWSVYAFLIAGCAVSILAALHFFGVDPFGFYENMKAEQTEQFLSTIGNIDLAGAYLCLLLPAAAGLYLRSDKARVLSAAAVFFSALAVIPCRAEGGMLALLCAGFICLRSGTKKGFFTAGLMIAALLTVCALMKLFPGSSFSLAGSSCWYAAKHWVLLLPAALSCFAAAKFAGNGAGRFFGKAVTVIAVLLALTCAGAFVYFSLFDRETPLRAILKYLRFSDTWGSYRGGVWKRCAKLFGSLPLGQKLLGVGPDSLSGPLYAAYGSEIAAFSGMRFDNAHCLPIQYLLTTGILGLLSIGAAAVLPLKNLFRSNDGVARAAGYGCLVYLICGLFTVNTPAISPVFWVLLYSAGAISCGGDPDAGA